MQAARVVMASCSNNHDTLLEAISGGDSQEAVNSEAVISERHHGTQPRDSCCLPDPLAVPLQYPKPSTLNPSSEYH